MIDSHRIGIVVAPPNDRHAFAVRHAARQMGADVRIVDTAAYMTDFDLEAGFGAAGQYALLRFNSGEAIDSRQVSGIWWRRPARPGEPNVPQSVLASTVRAEASHALFGSLNATVKNSFNSASHSRRAKSKPLQLAKAVELGFRVPSTLVTNVPQRARRFFDELDGNVVYKMFEGSDAGFFETRKLRRDDLPKLWRLQSCPLIFQEHVPGDFDIRATVVGGKVFASRIDFDTTGDTVDSRLTMTSTTALHLPFDVAKLLQALVQEFGLVYAAIDLRYSEQRGFTFFELNPEGQYLWNEIEAGLPISTEIALRLVGE